jgi:hypothetical protein
MRKSIKQLERQTAKSTEKQKSNIPEKEYKIKSTQKL